MLTETAVRKPSEKTYSLKGKRNFLRKYPFSLVYLSVIGAVRLCVFAFCKEK